MSRHSRKKCKSSENFMEHLCVKDLKVRDAKIKNLTVKNETVTNSQINDLTVNNETVNNLNTELINGMNYNCFFKTPAVSNFNIPFDCKDCEGNPIKPDNISQPVWDALTCNWKAYQQQLQAEFLEGRDQIRCIKKAFNCTPDCPPDCPLPEGCTGPCPSPPDCTIESGCIPDPNTCPQNIDNLLYATMTVPAFQSSPCENSIRWTVDYLTNLNYHLNVNNVSCTLSTRVASVLVHYAYVGTSAPTGATGNCPVCPGQTGSAGLDCICNQTDIVCGIIDVGCRQFGATININIGESFAGNFNIPTEIVQKIYSLHKDDNSLGAIQMVIFLEEGLETVNNKTRGKGGGGEGRAGGGGGRA